MPDQDRHTSQGRTPGAARVAAAVLTIAVAVLLALRDRSEPTGEIEGTVTLDGKPLAGGYVMFHPTRKTTPSESSGIFCSIVASDGSFRTSLPIGPRKVTVEGLYWKSMAVIDPPAIGRPVPERYRNKDRSSFIIDVKRGKQTFDLPLSSR
jgi:hypothetical protein